jgi:hypothetical protein
MNVESGNVTPFVPKNLRHERARAEGKRRDKVFFRNHPDRVFRARKSLPWEFSDWGARDHEHFGYILTWSDRMTGKLHSVGIAVKSDFPDDEDFLVQVFDHCVRHHGQNVTDISPEEHLRMLHVAGFCDADGAA